MQLADLIVPAVQLVATTDNAVFSKLGGLPNLATAVEWPLWKGKPLAFLGQIAVSELLPDSPIRQVLTAGYLYFFYDQEQTTWEFDPADIGSWKVIYSTEAPPTAIRDAPPGLEEDGIYLEKRVTFKPILSFPDPQRLGDTITDEELDALIEQKHAQYADQPHHQIGGYPDVVQNDTMELECQLASNGIYCGDGSGYEDPRAAALEAGASEWRLLLQLDSDDDTGWMWGDCGMLYFWIRESDLARRAFEKCWISLQCY